jgi:hypothetical protein
MIGIGIGIGITPGGAGATGGAGTTAGGGDTTAGAGLAGTTTGFGTGACGTGNAAGFGAGSTGMKLPGTGWDCGGAATTGGCDVVDAAVGRMPIVTATAKAAHPATRIPPTELPTRSARPTGGGASRTVNSAASSSPYSAP